jgi:hypothetical protein
MILGEVKRYLRDNSSIRVARSIKDLAYHALQIKEELTSELNREPSINFTCLGGSHLPSTTNIDYGFYGLANLQYFEMPSTINQIPKRTFDGCQQLFALDDLSSFNKNFLKNITIIGEYAFNGAAMKNTVIYEKTRAIGTKAFTLHGNLTGKRVAILGGKIESSGLVYDECGTDIFSGRNITL